MGRGLALRPAACLLARTKRPLAAGGGQHSRGREAEEAAGAETVQEERRLKLLLLERFLEEIGEVFGRLREKVGESLIGVGAHHKDGLWLWVSRLGQVGRKKLSSYQTSFP